MGNRLVAEQLISLGFLTRTHKNILEARETCSARNQDLEDYHLAFKLQHINLLRIKIAHQGGQIHSLKDLLNLKKVWIRNWNKPRNENKRTDRRPLHISRTKGGRERTYIRTERV